MVIGYVWAAAIGLALGSFVNTLVDRLPRRQSLIRPGSSCPGCGRRLAWWELIPLLSFLWLRGRCSSCGRPIGWRTPLVEALAGLLAGLLAWRLGLGAQAGLALAVGLVLIALGLIDLEHGLLPDVLTLPLLAGGLLWQSLAGTGLKYALLGGLICGGLMWAVAFGYRRLTGREGMGGGDPKLAAGLGVWLGPELGLEVVVAAAGAGALLGLGLVLAGRATLKTPLPFGVFLCASGLVWLVIWPPF